MMTDEYELTMSESYFLDGKKDEVVYFDAFFRSIPFESGYAIMAGGREIVDYIQNLKFTSDDIEYLRSLNTLYFKKRSAHKLCNKIYNCIIPSKQFICH